MKKILLALSLLYLAFCGTLSCGDQAIPSQASDCLQRTTSSKDSVCCYVEVTVLLMKGKSCTELPKGLNSDEIKKKLQQQNFGTIEDFSCSGSYLKIGLLLLIAFLL